MRNSIFFTLIYFSINLYSSSKETIDYSIIDHEIKGCPENSICTKENASDILKWQGLISQIKMFPGQKFKAMNSYLNDNGIPTLFLIEKQSISSFRPITWQAPCSFIKKENENIKEAMANIKGTLEDNALVLQQGKLIKIPIGENLILDILYVDKNKYYVPRGERPLYLDKEDLVFIKNEDDFFYGLKISKNGKWSIINIDLNILKKINFFSSEVIDCPKILNEQKIAIKLKSLDYCQTILEKNSNTKNIMRIVTFCD